MKKSIPVIVTIIIVVAAYYYFRLGGTQDLDFELVPDREIEIMATFYEGRYNSNEVQNLFAEARRLSKEFHVPLVVVNEGSDSQAKEIKQWIGILAEGENFPDSLKKKYSVKAYRDRLFIFTRIKSHNAVMPQPQDVREQAEKFALENNYELEDLSIEVYWNERNLEVFFPLKK